MSTTMTIHSGYSSDYRQIAPSRLSRHSVKIKSCSSFPNLLSLYQSPIREESNLEGSHVKPKRTKRVRRRRSGKAKKPDWEDAHENRQRQDMRSIRVNVVAQEQLEKFDQYVHRMRSKVEKQREDRKKYNETLQERLKEQEQAERKKLRLHRGPKHTYVHDKSYLKSLPISNHCKTTRLADDLQRKGVLRTRHDVEKFWAGYGNNHRNGVDIFAADAANSVNYPQHWIGSNKPEIKITDDDDDDSQVTDAHTMNTKTQLPPIKRR